jgi:hypothetical protein
MTIERRLDDASLDASAAAVHDAQLVESGLMGGADVFLNDGRNV